MPIPTLLIKGNMVGYEDEVPIVVIQQWIRTRMRENNLAKVGINNRVMIIKSDTGSGKSTILPVYIFRLVRDENVSLDVPFIGRSVICTQPRILTTKKLANDVASIFPDMKLGRTVGYVTSTMVQRVKHGLIYQTLAGLTQKILYRGDAYIMDTYYTIIVDEAHERSLDNDHLLLTLRDFYNRNANDPNLPFLILCSATIDTDMYAKYFSTINVFNIVGRTCPIETIWLDSPCNDFIKTSAEMILNNNDPGDLLVFLPGEGEIKKVITLLNNKKIDLDKYVIIPLSRQTVERDDISKPTNKRRIILSTVIAETGITLDRLGCVIDTGWYRTVETYQPWTISGLITKPAAQSRIKQRMGRVGRTSAGIFRPLYTEDIFNKLDSQQLPDIMIQGVSNIFLKIPNITNLLTPPNREDVLKTTSSAYNLGMIHADLSLTPLGKIAKLFFRTPFHLVKILMAGYIYQCAMSDLVTICAVCIVTQSLSREKIQKSPIKEFKSLGDMKEYYSDDFITWLIYADSTVNHYKTFNNYCETLGITPSNMITLFESREDIVKEMIEAGLDPFRNDSLRLINNPMDKSLIKALKMCIFEGLRMNILRRDGNRYKNLQGLDVYSKYTAKYIVTDSIMLSKYNNFNLPPGYKEIQGNSPHIYIPVPNFVSVVVQPVDPYFGIQYTKPMNDTVITKNHDIDLYYQVWLQRQNN